MADDLNPITRAEVFMSGNEAELTPITREEVILSGGDLTPVTRKEWFLKKYRGGGGSSITVEPLTVTQNGTQTAPEGKAYSPVTVNVPNSYANNDIGKVVNASRQLVSQSDYGSVNVDGTYDTTYYKSIIVNVGQRAPEAVYLNDGLDDGTATLANPFDGLNYEALMGGMSFSNAVWNAFIYFQFQGMEVSYHPFTANNAINAMAFLPNDGQGNQIGAYAQWDLGGTLSSLYMFSGGQLQDLSSMAASIPCRTIIYGTTEPTPAT